MSSRLITVSQQQAQLIDKTLFNECNFTVHQLMELAGLGCAKAIYRSYFPNKNNILLICGPGNNGGDGIVCARHLSIFGCRPTIYYPHPTKNSLFDSLIKQCESLNIPILNDQPPIFDQFDLLVDAVFGFSYKPRQSHFDDIIKEMFKSSRPICSIDVPSGWIVDSTDEQPNEIKPDCLISLTVPKHCALKFKGTYHWLSGRFLNSYLKEKFDLTELPSYKDDDIIMSPVIFKWENLDEVRTEPDKLVTRQLALLQEERELVCSKYSNLLNLNKIIKQCKDELYNNVRPSLEHIKQNALDYVSDDISIDDNSLIMNLPFIVDILSIPSTIKNHINKNNTSKANFNFNYFFN